MKILHSATLRNGQITAPYHEGDDANASNFKQGPAADALLAALTKDLGQKVVGFQVYTVESDRDNDGETIDAFFKAGAQPAQRRIDAPTGDVAKARDAFRVAMQAALNVVQE